MAVRLSVVGRSDGPVTAAAVLSSGDGAVTLCSAAAQGDTRGSAPSYTLRSRVCTVSSTE